MANRRRDDGRTPMHWRDAPGGGFTTGEPWLPLGDVRTHNVEAQRQDPDSTLLLVRDLIGLRRQAPDLRTGAYRTLEAPARVWAYARGDGFAVALNLGEAPATVDLSGTVEIATERAREGERIDGTLELGGSEGVIIRT